MTTGTRSYAVYGWESSFKSEATTKDKVFGVGAKISTLSFDNEVDAIYSLGFSFPVELQEKGFAGSWGADANLSNGYFFQSLMDTVTTTDNGDGTYTHELTVSGGKPKSMSIEVGSHGISSDVIRKILGAITTSVSISASVKNIVTVRLSGVYAAEMLGSSYGGAIADDEVPFTFAHSAVKMGGSVVGYIDSVDITINNNAELLWTLGDRIAADWTNKHYSVSGSFSMYLKDDEFIKRGYGSSSADSIQQAIEDLAQFEIVFDNKRTGADKREIKIYIPRIKIKSLSMSGLEGEGLIKLSIDWEGGKETSSDKFKVSITNASATLK